MDNELTAHSERVGTFCFSSGLSSQRTKAVRGVIGVVGAGGGGRGVRRMGGGSGGGKGGFTRLQEDVRRTVGCNVSLAGAATSIIFVATKVLSTFVATNTCLSQQKYACRDKIMFVQTNILLSRQAYFCGDKHVFVAKNICRDITFVTTKIFCRDKHNFVATNIILSRQAYFCRDKRRVLSTRE